jgi:hypothetical protein
VSSTLPSRPESTSACPAAALVSGRARDHVRASVAVHVAGSLDAEAELIARGRADAREEQRAALP